MCRGMTRCHQLVAPVELPGILLVVFGGLSKTSWGGGMKKEPESDRVRANERAGLGLGIGFKECDDDGSIGE